jgi:hypothetical protein
MPRSEGLNRRSLLKSLAAIAGLPVAARAVAPVSELVFQVSTAVPAVKLINVYDVQFWDHETLEVLYHNMRFTHVCNHRFEDVCPDPKA